MLKKEYATAQKLNILQESSVQLNLHHPNVVALMGIVAKPTVCIITEYCANGDVASVVFNPDYMVEPAHLRKMCLDTCLGMAYLHGANIVHRDLKSRNLLIDRNWDVKVADFGLACFVDEQITFAACGTPTHMAPEVFNNQQYTTNADVYSFGICLYEMAVRQRPYKNVPVEELGNAVGKEDLRPTIPIYIDQVWRNLMKACWDCDPLERPDFEQLVEILSKMELPLPSKKKTL